MAVSRRQAAAANSLTPAEIADGWILLFDGKTTFGWDAEGDIKAEDGSLILGGPNGGRIRSTCSFGDSEVVFELKPTRQRP